MYNVAFRNSEKTQPLLKANASPFLLDFTQCKGQKMTNPLFQKDIISISEFSKDHIELILKTAFELKAHPRNDLLKDKLIGVTFFEGSTRTRLSFETAIQRLGGRVIGFSDATNTSLGKKGETFMDSMRIITS